MPCPETLFRKACDVQHDRCGVMFCIRLGHWLSTGEVLVTSGVTTSLNQEGKNLAEGGAPANSQKKS